MPIDVFDQAVTHIAASDTWPDLVQAAHEAVTALGGAGTSVGMLEGDTVRQAARGFDPRLATRYSVIAVAEPLPGPHALRTRTTQLLEDRQVTMDRYPSAAPILEGSDLEAAACLPLLADDCAVGYLAAHYRGPHRFDRLELMMLAVTAAACAGVVRRLAAVPSVAGPSTPEPDDRSALASELDGLRLAMANRASIEQAKGMLMQRFGIGPEAAWNLLRRLSSVANTKVRDLADAIVKGDDVGDLEAHFPGQTSLSEPHDG